MSAQPAFGGTVDPTFGAVPRPPGWLPWLIIVAAVLSIVVGIAALVWPGPTLLAVGLLFGIYFVIWGVGLLISGIGGDEGETTGMRIIDVLLGALAIVAGFVLMARPGASIATVAFLLGFWWTFSGALQIARGVVQREGRAWNLVWGVVGLIAGIIILFSPEIALGTLVLIVGIGLIVQGGLQLMLGLAARKALRA